MLRTRNETRNGRGRQLLGLCLGLTALLAVGCDDAAPGSEPKDTGMVTADGGREDSGTTGPCEGFDDCRDGRICVEGTCTDCLANGECGGVAGGSGACIEGRCCAQGTEGCACGTGCGDGLTCESDRCAPADPPCDVGTEDCPCSAARACTGGDRCVDGACVACVAGTLNCPCDTGDRCDDPAVCTAGRCVDPAPPVCDAAACAALGRVCAPMGAECGACNGAGGFIETEAGLCEEVSGVACADDTACDAGQRCLALLPGRAPSCVRPPACIETETAAQTEGSVWSATAGACIPCGSCAGVAGSTGRLWPTSSRAGECVCETLPGYYFDVARSVQAPRTCDADGDGWVQRPARQYIESQDDTLHRNARCAPVVITEVRLVNERGESRTLDVVDDLRAEGPLALYEPDTLDDANRLATAEDIVPWGEALPDPAWLNPTSKLCVSATADFNGNGLSDLEEHPGATLIGENAWMTPYLAIGHFAELHTVTIDGDAGTLTIAERPRCAEGFPLNTLETAGGHWRECERKRDTRFRPGVAGFDLAAFGCDAATGTCPGLTPAERQGPEGLVSACSGPPSARFTGMNHHSQFTCKRLSDVGGIGQVAVVSTVNAENGPRLSQCVPDADGNPICARVDLAEDGLTGWLADTQAAGVTANYVNGCVPECLGMLATCPGYDADPEASLAGCNGDPADFGKLVCNGCPGSGTLCELPPNNEFGVRGACRAGVNTCTDGVLSCIPVQLRAPTGTADEFGDGIDTNCDEFDGVMATSIFVRSQGPPNGRNGSSERPFRDLASALALAAETNEVRQIYVASNVANPNPTLLETLNVPANVVAIIAGVRTESDPECNAMDFNQSSFAEWCPSADPDERHELLSRAAVILNVGPRDNPLRLQQLRLVFDGEQTATVNGPNGANSVGLRIDNAYNPVLEDVVVLDRVDIVTASGAAGQSAPAPDAAFAGADGDLGAAGCRVAAVTCGANCAEGYWLSGRGGDCVCGEGEACAGGDGGIGGLVEAGCQQAMVTAPEPGEPGEGEQSGAAGPGSLGTCGRDENPVNAVGGNGNGGAQGQDGTAGGGTYTRRAGWLPRAGTPGTRGRNGSGGGGGGGGNGAGGGIGLCPNRGGHGAGGGAGGCGGRGGAGAGTGGASIGLLLVAGNVVLEGGTIEAGDGGDGGGTSPGQSGGNGGIGGRDLVDRGHPDGEWQAQAGFGARGGDGGRGGNGGLGGSGLGGPTFAILQADLGADVVLGDADLNDVLRCGAPGRDAGEGAVGPARAGPDCVATVDFAEACGDDADCAGNERCVAEICTPREAVGGPCVGNDDCLDGYCVSDACVAPADLGDRCTSDAGCESGACIGGRCEDACAGHPDCGADGWCDVDLQLDARGVCKPLLADGEICEHAAECRSGDCDPTERFCYSPCDDANDCAAGEWCGGNRCFPLTPTGDACRVGAECPSGGCGVNGRCVECDDDQDCPGGYCGVLNQCFPLRQQGDGCGRNGVCESGRCSLIDGCLACLVNADCGAGNFCYLPVGTSGECVVPRPNGQACNVNGQCQSGTCVENQCRPSCNNDNGCAAGNFCFGGGCKPRLANGSVCAEARVCSSGICDVTCSACVLNAGCNGNQWCNVVVGGANSCQAKKGNGQQCSAARQCTGGACTDGRCRTGCNNDAGCPNGDYCHVGGCVPKLDNGAVCVEARVCESNVCDAACVDCVNDGQCSGAEVCRIRVGQINECISKQANGAACGRDAECTSNWCDVNRCRATLGAGSVCVENRVCTSGRCEFYGISPVPRCR